MIMINAGPFLFNMAILFNIDMPAYFSDLMPSFLAGKYLSNTEILTWGIAKENTSGSTTTSTLIT